MPLYENFPYTNFHELNLDWLVERVQSLEAAFPEGTIGIPKGGTGADNAAQARENLGIIAPNIPIAEGSTSTLDQEISRLEDNINTLAGDVKYRILRLVSDLGLTSGTATLPSCWAAMSIGDILIAPPSEFTPGQVPENSGSVVIVRNAGTSGSLRFYGNRTYEQEFQNNYPTGTWHTVLNDTDIIPVNKGGTGATTAEAARQNLGIDFSGTVLSVAGVGADTAGNVPLKLDNLVYNSLSELGLASGSTLSAVWTAIPNNSLLITSAAEISNPPTTDAGTLEVYKGDTSVPGFIRVYDKEVNKDFVMRLTSEGTPSNTWLPANKNLSVSYVPWNEAFIWRSDDTDIYVYLPCATLYEGPSYSCPDDDHGYSFMPTGASIGTAIQNLGLPHTITRDCPEMLTLIYTKPSSIANRQYGICSPRQGIIINTTI